MFEKEHAVWHVDVYGTGGVWRRRGAEERCVGPRDECDRDGREQESVRELHVGSGDESRDEHASAFSLLVGVVFRLGGLREQVFGEEREEASVGGGVVEGEHFSPV